MEYLCFRVLYFLNGVPRIVFYFYVYDKIIVKNIIKTDHMDNNGQALQIKADILVIKGNGD